MEETVILVAPVVFTFTVQYFVSAPLSQPLAETEYGLVPVVLVGPPRPGNRAQSGTTNGLDADVVCITYIGCLVGGSVGSKIPSCNISYT